MFYLNLFTVVAALNWATVAELTLFTNLYYHKLTMWLQSPGKVIYNFQFRSNDNNSVQPSCQSK